MTEIRSQPGLPYIKHIKYTYIFLDITSYTIVPTCDKQESVLSVLITCPQQFLNTLTAVPLAGRLYLC